MSTIAERALLEHCKLVYEAMDERSKQMTEGKVYEDFLTHLFTELGLSVPYYTQVTRALKSMDCIRMLRRGGGRAPSKWMLIQEPTVELFESFVGKSYTQLNKARNKGGVDQMAIDLNRRVSTLEAKVRSIEERESA